MLKYIYLYANKNAEACKLYKWVYSGTSIMNYEFGLY